jgi:peptidoglycan/xylan/chitin deacetylase (PgdA/CDA1 family)
MPILNLSLIKEFDTVVLMYHEVLGGKDGKETIRSVDQNIVIPEPLFKDHLDFLKENFFTSWHLCFSGSYSHLWKNLNKPVVVFTFDDGFAGNYQYVFPMLEQYGCKGIFFVIADRISRDHRYMTWGNLKEMSNSGHLIQSHTKSHVPLGELPAPKIYNELFYSKNLLEDKIGKEVLMLSLPFGSYSAIVKDIAYDVGYRYIFSSNLQHAYFGEVIVFGRISIKSHHTVDTIMKLLDRNSFYFKRTKYMHSLKTYIKGVIGLNNYRKIYRFIKKIDLE